MQRCLRLLLLVLPALGQTYNPLFDRLEGKDADPCAWTLDSSVYAASTSKQHCTTPTRPDSSVTVLLPSLGGTSPNVGGLFPTLTMIGRNVNGAGNLQFALSPAGGTCDTLTGVQADSALGTFVAGSLTTLVAFDVPNNWRTVTRELETAPRSLCYNSQTVANGRWTYTGFKIGVVWNCNDAASGQSCASRSSTGDYSGLTPENQAIRLARTTCCRIASVASDSKLGAIGQCINPNIESCCGSTRVDPNIERCCNASLQITTTLSTPCSCQASQTSAQSSCPSGELCCYNNKYSEFANVPSTATFRAIGQCYKPSSQRCCNTGHVYDPGSQQCCTINGVQSVNVPCPCSSDSHCGGGNNICCYQALPVPIENKAIGSTPAPTCNIYNNYPSGVGRAEQQTCTGVCIDARIHTCCNGAVCRTEYENCCNNTCCNKFAGKCALAYRPGFPGNKWNYNGFTTLLTQGYTNYTSYNDPTVNYLPYEQCTIIEQLSPIKSFWIFVLPAMLILASILLLSLSLTFATHVSSYAYHPIELALMGFAVLIAILAIPCFFATVYKYGVVMVVVASFTILVTAARSKWLNLVLSAVYIVALVYLFDPFNGNAFFTLASARNSDGSVDMESSGILHATGKNFHDIPNTRAIRYCTNYYNYFLPDPALHDYDRWDNPQVPTFGYCARSWIFALLIIEGFLLMLTLVNFVVSLLALILRFKEDQAFDPIELEVRGQLEY
eukprot:TRINITY_DN613_c0_g1_i1.p1 TRINITY_DN613_c0_g1~~TRINITY_DN613_c0_g1_i1.p1  ORF type:complete len:735 (-),score=150.86 TRINITY_DN613_c0_g1_i1:53-2230(-)